jgi:arylsulfatase A-like enzyme
MLKPGETCSVGRHRRIVAGMIAALDEGIGNISAAVKANGLADSITTVFTTDVSNSPTPLPLYM